MVSLSMDYCPCSILFYDLHLNSYRVSDTKVKELSQWVNNFDTILLLFWFINLVISSLLWFLNRILTSDTLCVSQLAIFQAKMQKGGSEVWRTAQCIFLNSTRILILSGSGKHLIQGFHTFDAVIFYSKSLRIVQKIYFAISLNSLLLLFGYIFVTICYKNHEQIEFSCF